METTTSLTGFRATHCIVNNVDAFLTGWYEANLSTGVTYNDDPWGDRSTAYDLGRTLAEAIIEAQRLNSCEA